MAIYFIGENGDSCSDYRSDYRSVSIDGSWRYLDLTGAIFLLPDNASIEPFLILPLSWWMR